MPHVQVLIHLARFQALDPNSAGTSKLLRLAAHRYNPRQSRAVTLRNLGDDAVAPLWTWRRIVHLDLSHNRLTTLPDLDLPFLEQLELSDNKIQQLPAKLLLPALVFLDLSHNKFVVVDPNGLPKLKHLNLSHNNLHNVTASMVRLCGPGCALNSIELEGNSNLVFPPFEIINSGGKEVCRFFKCLNQGQTTCWSQTVLVVGQETAGKTALCRALMGHQCPDQTHITEMSTVGIDTVHWHTVTALRRPNRSFRTSSIGGLRST